MRQSRLAHPSSISTRAIRGDGKPSPDPALFMQFLPRIREATDAVLNITTGGGHGMSIDDRLAAALKASPELASLNMGSMNFGLYPALSRYKEFKHAWETTYLEASRDFIFRNTFADIEGIIERLGKGHGTKFEFECYDVGHLYTLAHFLDRKLVQPPLFVQTIFGVLGGQGADTENSASCKTNSRQVIRTRLSVVSDGHGTTPVTLCHDGCAQRRECARWA